jgi:hypothetical protein
MGGRNTFLPFLGPTVFPCSLLQNHIPEGANTDVVITTRPGAKVLYWAAEPATEGLKTLKNWRDAYLKYENAGVTEADGAGRAVLRVRTPQPYTVPMRDRLEAHVHYRICLDSGGLSQIETVFLGGESEKFQNVDTPVVVDTEAETQIDAEQQPMLIDAEEAPESVAMEGFINEPLFATANPDEAMHQTFAANMTVDPRLNQLQAAVEAGAKVMFDTAGFEEGPATQGSILDAAFAPSA